jgi:hypothetical protein
MGRSKVVTSPYAGSSDAIRSTLVDSIQCRRLHAFRPVKQPEWEASIHFRRTRSLDNRVPYRSEWETQAQTPRTGAPFERVPTRSGKGPTT